MQATGGYVILRNPLVRAGTNGHTNGLKRPVSETDLRALNVVQATPWRINRLVLDVMLCAWVERLPLAGLAVAELKPLPPRVDPEVWAGMAEADKVAHRAVLRDIHSYNASAQGHLQAILDTLSVANDVRDRPSIWFPHSRCFRGRIHPIPAVGPHPQGSDLQKGLLMFANGLPLGPDGLFWLCVRAANSAGQDKLPLEDRVGWALERRELILDTAKDPLGLTWWAEADEPWSLLATVFELAMAFDMENPDEFVSHLPIPMDGSCNGLQHLSAMGLDPVGARATNLCAGAERQDIYEEVAAAVRRIVETDAAAGREEALVWHGRVTRKVVKRAVMTTPYGVTDSGIRTQLLADGHVPEEAADVGTGKAADYLRDCLVAALGQTVQAARSIMAWLQTAADRLARAGLPFDWTTPTGSSVRQAYHVETSSQIDTLCGKLRREVEAADGPLNPRKQALGAAPNYVHSFDAAHLTKTVVAAHERGIRSFAMIHDSYGTHAANTTELAHVLREEFVSIYSENWIAKLADQIAEYAPHVDLPPLPERGDFDLSQVLDAPFFFS